MPARLSIIEHQIPEIELKIPEIELGPPDVQDMLRRTLELQIPGFIIRQGAAHEATESSHLHWAVGATVCSALNKINPEYKAALWLYNGSPVLSQEAIGEFHHDLHDSRIPDPNSNQTGYNLHTTSYGGGDVFLAKLGTNPLRASKYRGDPNQQILDNQIDPRIIDPNVYCGTVKQGDTVVMLEGGRATAWHRFDTDASLGKRQAIASQVYGDSSGGFDLLLPNTR